MRAPRPQTLRQVRVTCTSANRVCRLLRSRCRCVASAAIQLRKLVVRSTKSPAGAVQSAQWRELDLSSSRAPAEFPAVMRCPIGSRTFGARPLAVELPTGKEHEGYAPSNSAAGESHLPDIPHSSINGIYRLTGTRYDFFQFFSDSALA